MRINILIENTVSMGAKGIKTEHGLSFLIENSHKKCLFDTGQTGLFMDNAKIMGLNIKNISAAVLSHGHYDHSGGLPRLVNNYADFTLYAHPDAFAPKLIARQEKLADIGMPITQDAIEMAGVQVKLNSGAVEILPGITSTGEVPMITDFETVEPCFFSHENVPDIFSDDQALILDTKKGLVVILGCAHRGVINTLHHVINLTGQKKIYALMGGLHLGNASDEKLKKVIKSLKNFDIKKIGAGHCTGFRAVIALTDAFKDRVFQISAGQVFYF